jgi:hypothetical protein
MFGQCVDDVVTFRDKFVAASQTLGADNSERRDQEACALAHSSVATAWGYDQRLRLELMFEGMVLLRLFFDKNFILKQVPADHLMKEEQRENAHSADAPTPAGCGGGGDLSVDGESEDDHDGQEDEEEEGVNPLEDGAVSDGEDPHLQPFGDEQRRRSWERMRKAVEVRMRAHVSSDFGETGAAVSWTSALIESTLESVKEVFEVGGAFLTKAFLAESAGMAEVVLKRSPHLAAEVRRKCSPAHWRPPAGILPSDLSTFRKDMAAHRLEWKARSGLEPMLQVLSGVSPQEKTRRNSVEGKEPEVGENDIGKGGGVQTNLYGPDATCCFLDIDDDRKVASALADFIASLEEDGDLQERLERDMFNVAHEIQGLPEVNEVVEKFDKFGDLRKQLLVRRLVAHVEASVRSSSSGGSASKHMSPECARTTKWIMQFFRNMIETKWGMSVDDRGEDGGSEQDQAAVATQLLLNNWGVTALCLDLVCAGIHNEVKIEAINLLIALLFREGGHHAVQAKIREHLDSHDSTAFFVEVNDWSSCFLCFN